MSNTTPILQPNYDCPFGSSLTWHTYKRHERKVAEALRYTAIDRKNLESWGEEYADMLRSIGDDVDSCFREMAKCVDRGCGSAPPRLSSSVTARRRIREKSDISDWNVVDYRIVFDPVYGLSQNSVSAPSKLGRIPDLKPFQDFAQGAIPSWWSGYNQIKHEYYRKMDEGKLGNVLSALAGLLVLNLLHKCSQHFLAMTGTVRGGKRWGAVEQTVGFEYLTEELQKSPFGIGIGSQDIDLVWLDTEVFSFKYLKA